MTYNKYDIVKNILEGMDTSDITVDIEKIRVSEKCIAVCAMHLEGKTYRQIGSTLNISTSRVGQLRKQAERSVLRYINAKKDAAAKKAAEKVAAAEKKERLEKVVPEKTETWRSLTIYDLGPSIRLVNCLVRWFEIGANEITIGMVVDALGDDYHPLSIRTLRNAGQKTWDELLMSLDRVVKTNDESSTFYKRYSNHT